MKKLLHERLREYVHPFRNIHIIEEREGVSTYPQMFEKWADEIERNYIPRPLFDDDEPVDFHERMGNGKHVRRIIFREDGWTVDSGKDGAKKYGSYNSGTCKTVPRYNESVLDADGVEIKVGDTVYDTLNATDSNRPMTAERITDDIRIMCKYDGSKFGHYLATELTHERPVFDAEGVRIRKGDTVWYTIDAEDWLKGRKRVVAKITDTRIEFTTGLWCNVFHSKFLTHHEPDSLEKLRDDMYAIDIPDCTLFSDRLTALIERGAK